MVIRAARTAAAIAARGRTDEHLRVEAQLLVYPALDPRQQHASHAQFADGYLLTRSDMEFYWDNYLPAEADRSDPRAAPATITDFTGLPPTVVATAGFDPLHDEGREYAQRLIEANVPTVYLPFPRLTHGFLDMADRVPAAQRAPRRYGPCGWAARTSLRVAAAISSTVSGMGPPSKPCGWTM